MSRRYQRHRPTLRQSILALFAQRPGQPIHYTRLASKFPGRKPRQVLNACWKLWCQGRLVWYKEGVYQLPQEQQKEGRHG